jgi:hypothetical protein
MRKCVPLGDCAWVRANAPVRGAHACGGKPFLIALSLLAVAAPSFALADSNADGYPPGLFERSPLIDPSHPAKQAQPSAPEGPLAHRFRRLSRRR